MSLLQTIQLRGHEQVSIFQDKPTGIKVVFAIHDTTLGPALGGCRLRPYDSLDIALADVVQLSEAMTYRNAISGINFGGGQSAIFPDPARQDLPREDLFLAYGRFLAQLSGVYIATEDMGTTISDMGFVHAVCENVAGKDARFGGGGDPARYAAMGVICGMKACLRHVHGNDSISGRRVAIEGLGRVGVRIARLLKEQGAELVVADVEADIAAKIAAELGAEVVSIKDIHAQPCDIFAPCGIGGTINSATVLTLGSRIVAGCANNQLDNPATETALLARGVTYAPDFVINAGGVILCADEREPGGFRQERVQQRVEGIYQTLLNVLSLSSERRMPSGRVAIELAQERIYRVRGGEPDYSV
ncbi:MAG: Glu/Leu/Phe/Val dehydrogenase dimerization domain-containing protein [bacterium]|nr:Glu/Leu/Phe/Val dehydrogenase dimerization domain-containing protein [bacterium]